MNYYAAGKGKVHFPKYLKKSCEGFLNPSFKVLFHLSLSFNFVEVYIIMIHNSSFAVMCKGCIGFYFIFCGKSGYPKILLTKNTYYSHKNDLM